ncbi:MAG TPA: response regulator [Thermoanaerobaculia bacterium]|nr:response regulator [Thermoanaerobaculia bacterium]
MPRTYVLVVDDDDAVRHLVVEVLKEDAALQVDSARDGVDALHHVSTHRYDLVILDVMMPHMTGIDFLDSLQALSSDPSVQSLRDLPAVVVITSASPEQIPSGRIEERFPSMVRSVLRKPLQSDQLRECVARCLR